MLQYLTLLVQTVAVVFLIFVALLVILGLCVATYEEIKWRFNRKK
jgi:hypothetical protein